MSKVGEGLTLALRDELEAILAFLPALSRATAGWQRTRVYPEDTAGEAYLAYLCADRVVKILASEPPERMRRITAANAFLAAHGDREARAVADDKAERYEAPAALARALLAHADQACFALFEAQRALSTAVTAGTIPDGTVEPNLRRAGEAVTAMSSILDRAGR